MRFPQLRLQVIHIQAPQKPAVRMPPAPRTLADIERDAWILDAHVRVKSWRWGSTGFVLGASFSALLAAGLIWGEHHLAAPAAPKLAAPGPSVVVPLRDKAPVFGRLQTIIPVSASAASAPVAAFAMASSAARSIQPATSAAPAPAAHTSPASSASLAPKLQPATLQIPPLPPTRLSQGDLVEQQSVRASRHEAESAQVKPVQRTTQHPIPRLPEHRAIESSRPAASKTGAAILYTASSAEPARAPAAHFPSNAPANATVTHRTTERHLASVNVVSVPMNGMVLVEESGGRVLPFKVGQTLPNGEVLESADAASGSIQTSRRTIQTH